MTIVVGILLALAADAGRQYLADREAEREILAALRVEFAADVREIEADQKSRAAKLTAIKLLGDLHAGTAERPEPEELAATLMQTVNWRFYTASHPVLDDLLTTGQLDLITSDDLRLALMKFGQERSRIAVTEEQERNFVVRELEPYLAARLDLEALVSPRSPEQFAATARAVPSLIPDTTFSSLEYLNRKRTETSMRYAGILLDAVSAVQKLLGEET